MDSANIRKEYQKTLTNIRFMLTNKKPKIVVTSVTPLDGKSQVAYQLAKVAAEDGLKVLYADMNFEEPALKDKREGITEAVLQAKPLSEVIRSSETDGLFLLGTGDGKANSIGVYYYENGSALQAAIESMDFDLVVFDSPTMLENTEAAVLSKFADGLVIVIDRRFTKKSLFKRAMQTIELTDVKILGTIINND